jgi:hypothetical protein
MWTDRYDEANRLIFKTFSCEYTKMLVESMNMKQQCERTDELCEQVEVTLVSLIRLTYLANFNGPFNWY